MIDSSRDTAGRSALFPPAPLEGCSNYKRYFYIDRDGSVTERVLLNILDKRTREHVICVHFMQFLVKHIIGDTVGFNVLSRDDPWDFKLGLSTGATFNLEIVSIADNRLQFEVLTREEVRDNASYRPQLRLRDLAKIAGNFPDQDIVEAVARHRENGVRPDDLVDNPDFGQAERIYVSTSESRDGTLAEIIDRAIESKENKSAPGKEETVLIVDNRTSVYFIHEIIAALEALNGRLANSPFREIWFYNGYCSDNDGRRGQYTFIACKATQETERLFAEGAS